MSSENLQTNNLEVPASSETKNLNQSMDVRESQSSEVEFDVAQRLVELKSEIDQLQQDVHAYYEKSLLREEIEEKLVGIKEEVDALQIAVMEVAALPWYRNASVIVATLAMVFSLGTAFMSFYQVYEQQKREAKKELREVLQQLAELPKKNMELRKAYENDPIGLNTVVTSISQENVLLAQQAREIAERFPNVVTAFEYQAISTALFNVARPDDAYNIAEKGLLVTDHFVQDLELLRIQGSASFAKGNKDLGRKKFSQALEIHNKYSQDGYLKTAVHYITYSNAFTLSSWGAVEFGFGECQKSEQLLRQSETLANQLPDLPDYNILRERIKTQLEFLSKNRQNCNN